MQLAVLNIPFAGVEVLLPPPVSCAGLDFAPLSEGSIQAHVPAVALPFQVYHVPVPPSILEACLRQAIHEAIRRYPVPANFCSPLRDPRLHCVMRVPL